MAYYQMDDGFDTDLRVIRAGTAAFGLYSRCGVWVAHNLTDGFVPSEVANLYGTREWIEKLVATGLWELAEGGFVMPDYLEPHGNKTADVVRKRRADAAARQQKLRDGRKPPNTSRVTSRVTNAGGNAGSHGSLSDPPPKGGEEGGAALRAGAAPPSRKIKTTSGRLLCETHQQEISDTAPCRGCAADAVVAAAVDDDLDQRPPVPIRTDRSRPSNQGSDVPRNFAAARSVLDPLPNREEWLDAARKHLAELGEVTPTVYRTTVTAAELYQAAQQPDPPPAPEEE